MNYGDFPLEETIHMFFTTRAFATGIPGTLSAATVAVYEDITATPIETGVAVTESLNSIAGLNAVPIVAIAASGYEVGKNYHVVIEAGTVDSVSVVGEVIGYFSLSRSAAAVDLANASDGLGAIKTETALIVADTDSLEADIAALNDLSAAQVNAEVDTALTDIHLDHLFAASVADEIVNDSAWADLVSATGDWSTFVKATDSLQAIRDHATTIKSETALIVADTDELQQDDTPGAITALNNISTADVNAQVDIALTDINLDHFVGTASGIPALPAGTYLDLLQDDGVATYDRSTDSLQAVRDHATTIKSETALIVADTNELQADNTPGAIAALNNITAASVWAVDATGEQDQGTFGQAIGDPGADADTIYGATVTGATGANIAVDILAVKAETALILDDTDLIDDGTSGLAKIATDVAAVLVDTGTTLPATLEGLVLISKVAVGATGNTTTAVHLATGTGSYSDDELNGFFLVLLDNGTGEWHVREITDWTNTGDIATVATLPFTPATDDFYWLLSAQAGTSSAPTAAAVADAVWDEAQADHVAVGSFGITASEIAAVVADLANGTDGLGALKTLIDTVNSDLANGTDGLGALKTLIDAIPLTAMRGTDSAATAANLVTVDTVVDAIKVITDQMVFTKANELDANTQSINGAAVVGDGNATPWDGA